MARVVTLMPVTYSSCEVFSSDPLTCPLCRVVVPAWTHHRCEKKRLAPVDRSPRKTQKDINP